MGRPKKICIKKVLKEQNWKIKVWRGKYKRIERIEFKGLEKIIQIWKLRCGEAIKFEFEFKGLEMIKMGKLRCG